MGREEEEKDSGVEGGVRSEEGRRGEEKKGRREEGREVKRERGGGRR